MKKNIINKSISLFLALTMIISSTNSLLVYADIPTNGLIKTKTEETGNKTVKVDGINYILDSSPSVSTPGTAYVGDNRNNLLNTVEIPDIIDVNGNKYYVTRITENAFYENKAVTSMYIGKNVERIPTTAFLNCPNLKEFTVNEENKYFTALDGILYNRKKDTVLSSPIGKKIESYSVPKTVTKIGDYAFYGNDKLYIVNSTLNLTEIGEYAFADCSSLKSIGFGNNVSRLGKYAFAQTAIENIVLPKKITEIEEGLFFSSALKNVRIPSQVTTIGYCAFYNCNDLDEATFPNGLESISEYAFMNTSIKELNFPASLKEIKYSAFAECSGLTKLTLNSNIKTLGDYSFYNCPDLATVSIPARTQSIGNYAFAECEKLTTINVSADNETYETIDGILYTKGRAELIVYPSGKLDLAYEIPTNVKTIRDGALNNCRYLNEFKVEGGNTSYSVDENGVLYNYDKTKLIQYPIGRGSNNYTIAETVTSIGKKAFAGALITGIVNIPSYVSEIGEYAFEDCTKVNNYNVYKQNNDFKSIDGVLFTNDGTTLIQYPLSSTAVQYTVPSGVITLSSGAFKSAENLKEIKLNDTLAVIENSVFENSSIEKIELPESLNKIYTKAFSNSNLTEITIPESVNKIGDKAFMDCSSLRFVTFKSITPMEETGNSVFKNTPKLEKISVPAGTTNLYKKQLTNMDLLNVDTLLIEE